MRGTTSSACPAAFSPDERRDEAGLGLAMLTDPTVLTDRGPRWSQISISTEIARSYRSVRVRSLRRSHAAARSTAAEFVTLLRVKRARPERLLL